MKNLKLTTLALALTISATALATAPAKAETAVKQTTTITKKEPLYTKSSLTISTRRVGMVGGRPYPLIVKEVNTKTVNTDKARNYKNTEIVRTTTSVTDVPISQSQGGTYYTNEGQKAFDNGDMNVILRNTGSYND